MCLTDRAMKIKSGKYYRVQHIADNAIGVKLVCLGILPGKIIRLIRQAPLGGGYYLSFDDKRIGISKHELSKLELTEISTDQNLIQ